MPQKETDLSGIAWFGGKGQAASKCIWPSTWTEQLGGGKNLLVLEEGHPRDVELEVLAQRTRNKSWAGEGKKE